MCITSTIIITIDMISVISSSISAKKNIDFMSEDKHLNFKQKHK